jgi:nitronate monooxygenase
MPRIETALTRLLAIEHPILLAPMGSAAGGKLAAAVTSAGGLGMIGSGQANATTIRQELGEAGNARVGIGFITWALERNPAALDVALDASPAAVMLSFGDPTPFTGRIKAAGCLTICQVQTLAQAIEAAAAGADIIIAQGRDAGGHSGTTRGTMGLVPPVVDAVAPIPVVAAGGIADGRGLAAALALGAAGISMGTRFTASRESLWDQAMKEAALRAGGDQTEQTRVFDICPRLAMAGDLSRQSAAQRLFQELERPGGRAGGRSAGSGEGLFGDGSRRVCNPRPLGRGECRSGQGYSCRIDDHRTHHCPGGRDADRRSSADTPVARGANHTLDARFEGQPSTPLSRLCAVSSDWSDEEEAFARPVGAGRSVSFARQFPE